MALAAADLNGVKNTVASMLGRFAPSVILIECGPVSVTQDSSKKGIGKYTLSYPKPAIAREIRDCWKNDRRKLPRAGVVFPDGSILTVLFEWKPSPVPLSHREIESYIQIVNETLDVIGYVSEYSYCFYPNSKIADEIGYFRYDFHVEAMGEGDLGQHGYFHFHRSTTEEFRHATGPLLDFDTIVCGLESILAKDTRRARLRKTFDQGDFHKLALDLTPGGIRCLADELLSKNLSKFPHIKKLEEFLGPRQLVK